MKHKKVNSLEYQEILKRLVEIDIEEDLLKSFNKTHQYMAHVEFPDSFPLLLISLKKDNEALSEELNYYLKKVLSVLPDKITRDELLILIFYHEIPDDYYLISEFKEYLPIIKNLKSKIDSNDFLFHYISDLLAEKNELIQKKNEYESSFGKRKKRIIFDKHQK